MIPRRRINIDAADNLSRQKDSDAALSDESIASWEQAVSQHVGVEHAVAVGSGRSAMSLILEYLGKGDGEVIVPAYTLKDLLPLITALGADPIPVDILPDSFNMDPAAIEKKITSRTRAIMVLHAFGAPCRIDEIVEIAKRHDIPLIEDCAHSLGATAGGKQTGSFGYAGFYSFESTKPVNTWGGGMAVTDDSDLADFVRRERTDAVVNQKMIAAKIRSAKLERRLFSSGLSWSIQYLLAAGWSKSMMTMAYRCFQSAPPADSGYAAFQAERGLRELTTLDERIALRNKSGSLYRSLLKPEIVLQDISESDRSTCYFLVAVLPCESAPVRRKLLWRGIDCGVEDEIADNCADLLGSTDCPVMNSIYSRAIALPIYDGIEEDTIKTVVSALNSIIS